MSAKSFDNRSSWTQSSTCMFSWLSSWPCWSPPALQELSEHARLCSLQPLFLDLTASLQGVSGRYGAPGVRDLLPKAPRAGMHGGRTHTAHFLISGYPNGLGKNSSVSFHYNNEAKVPPEWDSSWHLSNKDWLCSGGVPGCQLKEWMWDG